MSQFQKNLALLPRVEHIESLQLWEENGIEPVAVIDNLPGKAGSVAVYHFLLLEYGCLNPIAAQAGLDLFAEHVAAAREHPGSHPNIDRLFDIIKFKQKFLIKVINNTTNEH